MAMALTSKQRKFEWEVEPREEGEFRTWLLYRVDRTDGSNETLATGRVVEGTYEGTDGWITRYFPQVFLNRDAGQKIEWQNIRWPCALLSEAQDLVVGYYVERDLNGQLP